MSRRSLRITVVDDDPLALRVTAAALRSLGHEVATREQALGSLPVITRERPDVVVLDLSMPGLSGEGLGDLIREASGRIGRRIALIICSGAEDPEAQEAARQIGAIGVVHKGVSADALREAFALALARVDAGQDARPPMTAARR